MSWIRGLRMAWSAIVDRRREERETEEEFRHHLEMETEKYLAEGHSPREAARLARIAFGGVEKYRQEVREERGVSWLEDAVSDTRILLRSLLRIPGFVFATVGILAVVIALDLLVFGLFRAYLLRPIPIPEPATLASIDYWTLPGGEGLDPWGAPTGLNSLDWSPLEDLTDGLMRMDWDAFALGGMDRPEWIDGAWVTPGWFAALGTEPAFGRFFDADDLAADAPTVAVISHSLWTRHFGADPAVLGKVVRADSLDLPEAPDLFTVVGVLPENFWNFDEYYDFLAPLRRQAKPRMLRSKPGVSFEQVAERMAWIVRTGSPEPVDPRWRPDVKPAADAHVSGARIPLWTLLGIAVLLTLIAFGNAAALVAVRSAGRLRELALRSALGARWERLARQLVLEGLVLGGSASFLALAIASLLSKPFALLAESKLSARLPGGSGVLALDAELFAVAIGLGFTMGIALGLIPSLSGVGSSVGNALRSVRIAGHTQRGRMLRNALVAGEVLLSLTLLILGGLMTKSALSFAEIDLGYDPQGVVSATLFLQHRAYPEAAHQSVFYRQLVSRVETLPGIRSVTLTRNSLAYARPSRMNVEGDRNGPDSPPEAVVAHVGGGFFETLEVPVLAGRGIRWADGAHNEKVVVVSRSFADRAWPGESALDRRLRLSEEDPWHRVVGVVGEVRESLLQPNLANVYFSAQQYPSRGARLIVQTSLPLSQAFGALRSSVRDLDPELPILETTNLAESSSRGFAKHRFLAVLLVGGASFAILLAFLGLYAVVAFAIGQRRREIAVRKAIGASAWRIVGEVVCQNAVLVAVALVFGGALARILAEFMVSLLYGVGPGDPWIYGLLTLALGAVASTAVFTAARRAAFADPMEVLRQD